LLLANSLVALTLAQQASLWAIRIAMAILAVGYWMQIRTRQRNSKPIAWLWVCGASLAAVHTVSALWAFHGGSHADAVVATADRTEALFGIRVGAGVYVNYVFVVVWWLDAALRAGSLRWLPDHSRGPMALRVVGYAIDGFLIGMAISGSIVFASGPIRYVGLACMGIWILGWRMPIKTCE